MTSPPPKNFLNNPKYLFTLLTAIVKKYDGEVELSVEDFGCVTKHDLISLYYNKENQSVTLKSITLPPVGLGEDDN